MSKPAFVHDRGGPYPQMWSTPSLSGNWKQHPIYTNYWFCDDGRVLSTARAKPRLIVGTRCGQMGYRAIPVANPKKIYVHRTICELFNGPPAKNQQCRHLDGDIENNSAANLM